MCEHIIQRINLTVSSRDTVAIVDQDGTTVVTLAGQSLNPSWAAETMPGVLGYIDFDRVREFRRH